MNFDTRLRLKPGLIPPKLLQTRFPGPHSFDSLPRNPSACLSGGFAVANYASKGVPSKRFHTGLNFFETIVKYESFSDVGESRVWFASKNLKPCRMHLNAFLIAQIIAKCHSFPNM